MDNDLLREVSSAPIPPIPPGTRRAKASTPIIYQPFSGGTVMDELQCFLEQKFAKHIRASKVIPASGGHFAPHPKDLHPKLAAVLQNDGIAQLYGHQAESFEAINRREDTVIVSQTASGKTLAFLLPILSQYLSAKQPFSVLLMYPTKALARDQEQTVGKLLLATAEAHKVGTFDGDTPQEDRDKIQRLADFVITNPDMLHSGILPNHQRKWRPFLSRLAFIVIDEVHTYRGAFGSHVANVFRRLIRTCELHGSRPVFVCCSATIGNPQEHVQALCGRPFTMVNRDDAPRPERSLYFVNPPLIQSQGQALYRKGPSSVIKPLIREASRKGIRTICFCRGRQEVERLHRATVEGHPELYDKVKPYRGGLLPNERRKLERALFNGEIRTIITTNALELGIDIGDLDLCLMAGHPGSFASFWQQAGRVGRKGKAATIVYVAKDQPIDQFLVHHPEFLLSAPIEQAWLSADNPYIILQHLPCAAYEHPLRQEESLFSGSAYPLALEVLKNDKTVMPYREWYRYALQDYPARGVNIRGMIDYNVDIYCGTEVIGEIDPIGARGTLYKDAIYQHLGRRYMSLELDLEKKLCRVEPVAVDYFTEASWESRIEMTEAFEKKNLRDFVVSFGAVNVNRQPKLYKKIREKSFENIGYGPITLDPFIYDTTGFCLYPSVQWQTELEKADKRYIAAAFYGLSYILRRTAPSLCMGDVGDIDTDVSLQEIADGYWKSSLYLFDSHEGGVGYSEKVYERLDEALRLCQTIINACECEAGCPSCVPPTPPGVSNTAIEELFTETDAATACTLSLISCALDGMITVPRVTVVRHAMTPAIAPPQDEEKKKLEARLGRAAVLLKKKRERVY